MAKPVTDDTSISAKTDADKRASARAAFAAQHLPDGAELIALPADASFRSYYRVRGADMPMLLMDAPPGPEDLPAYLRIDSYLLENGLAAPKVMASDIENGFALIEDFGDRTYTRLLASGADETALYALAIDVLAALHRCPIPTGDSGIADYNLDRLLAEAGLFPDWYWEHVTGTPPSADQRERFMAMMAEIMGDVAGRRECLVLRDYHVDNLMLRPDQPEGDIASCGLLDFQDGLIGARAYDLMSLFEDARRDVPPELAEAMRVRYLTQCPPDDPVRFEQDYRALAIGRHAKILGIFVRLNKRDGKPKYLQHLPRIAGQIGRHLEHPSMADLKAFLDTECPGWRTPNPAA